MLQKGLEHTPSNALIGGLIGGDSTVLLGHTTFLTSPASSCVAGWDTLQSTGSVPHTCTLK